MYTGRRRRRDVILGRLWWSFVFAVLMFGAGAVWLFTLAGCKGMIQATPAVDVAVASTDTHQSADAGGDVVITSKVYDEWAPRIDAATRFVDALKKWSVWLVLSIPLATYILPKLVWRGIQQLTAKKKAS